MVCRVATSALGGRLAMLFSANCAMATLVPSKDASLTLESGSSAAASAAGEAAVGRGGRPGKAKGNRG